MKTLLWIQVKKDRILASKLRTGLLEIDGLLAAELEQRSSRLGSNGGHQKETQIVSKSSRRSSLRCASALPA
jgi:hypothetical protein